jgi:hypothetical protein
MSDVVAPGSLTVPVLIACVACGNIEDLIIVLGSSFGLTGLVALGQHVLSRIRQTLGYSRVTSNDTEAAVCALDERSKSG